MRGKNKYNQGPDEGNRVRASLGAKLPMNGEKMGYNGFEEQNVEDNYANVLRKNRAPDANNLTAPSGGGGGYSSQHHSQSVSPKKIRRTTQCYQVNGVDTYYNASINPGSGGNCLYPQTSGGEEVIPKFKTS